MPRLSRGERQDQTRSDLIDAARRVFLRGGFHRASLSEIAEEAGYSTGAVYSNFDGKDELFLAVLDARHDRRWLILSSRALGAATIEDAIRESARELAEAARSEPAWTPLLVEYWTHAAGRPELVAAVEKRHGQLLDELTGMLDELAARYGAGYTVPTREVARAANALGRGIALERLADPASVAPELFEEMFVALVRGLIRLPASVPGRTERTQP